MMLPWQKRPLALNSPRDLPGLALWLDSKDVSSLRNDAGAQPVTTDGIKLASDKSGNSSTNVLCLNGVAGNRASFTALTAFGTGNFSVSARVTLASPIGTSNPRLFGSATNGFDLAVLTADGTVRGAKTNVGNLVASTGAVSAWADTVVGYTRSGTTGTYYINGVAVGTITDNNDYTVGLTRLGADAADASVMNGIMQWARVYNAALTGPQMLADAGGTVQSNCILDARFDLQPKLATSFTESSSNAATVTINTSGATGARISGARDLYQGTAANQPILTIAAGGNYLTFDGSNDYLKAAAFALAQPETVYFVGSQVTWTNQDAFLDGNSNATSLLFQRTSTPEVGIFAGASIGNISLALNTVAILTGIYNNTASAIRLNRESPVTGTAGTSGLNGLIVGNRADLSTPANITASEVVVYAAAHDKATQERVIAMLARNNRIALT